MSISMSSGNDAVQSSACYVMRELPQCTVTDRTVWTPCSAPRGAPRSGAYQPTIDLIVVESGLPRTADSNDNRAVSRAYCVIVDLRVEKVSSFFYVTFVFHLGLSRARRAINDSPRRR
jgi:hypothetical protein